MEPTTQVGWRPRRKARIWAGLLIVGVSWGGAIAGAQDFDSATVFDSRDPSGVLRTIATNGRTLEESNPFFQSLGANGRSCVSCHVPSNAWTISPRELRRRFDRTDGLDPIFRTVDGSNSPAADVSTRKKRLAAYSMLLKKGVIRVELPIPAGAEFSLTAVDDPYNHASAAGLSLFRRPLPSTNLRFLTGVMWDSRETVVPFAVTAGGLSQDPADLIQDLLHQAADATTGHAQAPQAPDSATLQRIVDFELNLATAQQSDDRAGHLDARGALGGAFVASQLEFYVSINDVLGGDALGNPFDPTVMSLYTAWNGSRDGARAAVARGAALFNTKPIAISGVAGLNDKLGVPVIAGHCTTCHDTPNVGNHSVPFPIDIGLSDASRRGDGMPLYTLKNNATGAMIRTTDPGRALVTGKWADVNKFKGPILRGLAARPPYFHNGFADDLGDAIDFYNTRFNVGITDDERADLVAFLRTL